MAKRTIELPQEAERIIAEARSNNPTFSDMSDSEVAKQLILLALKNEPQNTEDKREKAQAAYTLSDEIFALQLKLEQAEVVLQEMTDNYFGAHERDTESGRFSILWDYHRNGIFSDIVSDCLYELRKRLESLSELERTGSAMKHQKRRDEGHAKTQS